MESTITRTIKRTVATIVKYDKATKTSKEFEKPFDTKVTRKAIERTLKDGEMIVDVKTSDVTYEMALSDFIKGGKDITEEYATKRKAIADRAKANETKDKPVTQNFATQEVK